MSVKVNQRLLNTPFKNNWERDFAQLLDQHKQEGRIKDWWYESLRFEIGKGAWYKPDFPILMSDNEMIICEVKGRKREAGIAKIKAAALRHPFRFFLVSKQKGAWVYDEV